VASVRVVGGQKCCLRQARYAQRRRQCWRVTTLRKCVRWWCVVCACAYSARARRAGGKPPGVRARCLCAGVPGRTGGGMSIAVSRCINPAWYAAGVEEGKPGARGCNPTKYEQKVRGITANYNPRREVATGRSVMVWAGGAVRTRIKTVKMNNATAGAAGGARKRAYHV